MMETSISDFNKNGCAGVDECTTEDCQATDGAGILAGVSFASCLLVLAGGAVVGALF
jgi:hypothetical protein